MILAASHCAAKVLVGNTHSHHPITRGENSHQIRRVLTEKNGEERNEMLIGNLQLFVDRPEKQRRQRRNIYEREKIPDSGIFGKDSIKFRGHRMGLRCALYRALKRREYYCRNS